MPKNENPKTQKPQNHKKQKSKKTKPQNPKKNKNLKKTIIFLQKPQISQKIINFKNIFPTISSNPQRTALHPRTRSAQTLPIPENTDVFDGGWGKFAEFNFVSKLKTLVYLQKIYN